MAKFHPKVNFKKPPALINSAKFVQELKKKGDHVLRAARQALKVGVDSVVKDAKLNVPVDTGRLQQGITANTFGIGAAKGTGYLITASAKAGNKYPLGKDSKGKTVWENVDYAQYVEFDPRINKPYLYPAVKKNRGNIYKLIRTAVEMATRGNS